LKNYPKGSNVANHAWQNKDSIDFDNAYVIDRGNYRVSETLESWHTAKTVDADTSEPLSATKYPSCCLSQTLRINNDLPIVIDSKRSQRSQRSRLPHSMSAIEVFFEIEVSLLNILQQFTSHIFCCQYFNSTTFEVF